MVTILALIAGLVAVVQSNRADDQAAAGARPRRHWRHSNPPTPTPSERSPTRSARPRSRRRSGHGAEADTAFVNLTNTSILERGNRQDLAALLAIEAYRIDPERSRVRRCSRRSPATSASSATGTSKDANAVVGIVPLPDGTDALGALDGGRLVRFDIATGSSSKRSIPSTQTTARWTSEPCFG